MKNKKIIEAKLFSNLLKGRVEGADFHKLLNFLF